MVLMHRCRRRHGAGAGTRGRTHGRQTLPAGGGGAGRGCLKRKGHDNFCNVKYPRPHTCKARPPVPPGER